MRPSGTPVAYRAAADIEGDARDPWLAARVAGDLGVKIRRGARPSKTAERSCPGDEMSLRFLLLGDMLGGGIDPYTALTLRLGDNGGR